jgi:hypothetical protein
MPAGGSLSWACWPIFLVLLAPSSLALAAPPMVKACTNFGCKHQAEVALSDEQWQQLQRLFAAHPPSPEQERQRIGEAIAWIETWVGSNTGTSADRAGNAAAGEPGQLDCIAESLNTTAYLQLLAQQGWLRWHQVGERVKRSPLIFDVHWTAVIVENASGQAFAVDSWFFDNGRPPYIQPLEDWKRKRDPG